MKAKDLAADNRRGGTRAERRESSSLEVFALLSLTSVEIFRVLSCLNGRNVATNLFVACIEEKNVEKSCKNRVEGFELVFSQQEAAQNGGSWSVNFLQFLDFRCKYPATCDY